MGLTGSRQCAVIERCQKKIRDVNLSLISTGKLYSRKRRETPCETDCIFEETRSTFSTWCHLKNRISFEIMLFMKDAMKNRKRCSRSKYNG